MTSTSSPTIDRRSEHSDPLSSHRSRENGGWRAGLVIFGLVLVTACRWQTMAPPVTLAANWLLVLLLVLLSWTCRRPMVIGLTLIVLLIWSGLEAVQGASWIEPLAGQTVRLFVAVWLVAWLQRVRARLEKAHRQARLDSLTGLPNRQALVDALDAELSRTRRFGRPFTVALLDCDGFKGINDRGGHLAGDEVLRRIGHALRQHTRRYDCVGRLGGDEFLLVLSEVDRDGAVLVSERLRAALRHFVEREYATLTFSLGVVTFYTADLDWQGCVQRADEAMYSAKRAGPDQTRFAVVEESLATSQPSSLP